MLLIFPFERVKTFSRKFVQLASCFLPGWNMLLDNKIRNLWTSFAKERRSPELTAAMILKRVMAK